MDEQELERANGQTLATDVQAGLYVLSETHGKYTSGLDITDDRLLSELDHSYQSNLSDDPDHSYQSNLSDDIDHSYQSKLSETDFGDVPQISAESSMLHHDDYLEDDIPQHQNSMVGHSHQYPHENIDSVHQDSQSNYRNEELYDTVTYPVDDNYVYHRQPHCSDSVSDIDIDSEEELEEKYREEMRRREKQIDPGPFKYNRTMCMAAIPCSVLIIALAGEMLILLMCFATSLILLIDPGGYRKRSVVIFVFLFVPCHGLVVYSFFPFIWLSVANVVLIGAANLFVLFTGAWMLLQFSIFRKQETDLCQIIEQLLFIMYPAVSVVLLTWALSTLVPGQYVSYILILLGFLYLQVFSMPRTSCFQDSEADIDDGAIIKPHFLLLMILSFIFTPSLLHFVISLYDDSHSIFQLSFMVQLVFISTLSLFLSTLLSLRHIFEHNGWPYSVVTRTRWVTGVIATSLSYPVLREVGLPSHFLPWLPWAIAVYSACGLLLFYKHMKMFTVLAHLSAVALCVAALYSATYWRVEVLSLLLCMQTAVFILSEIMLYISDLYGSPVIVLSGLLATYMIHRLQFAFKLLDSVAGLCMTAHVTKATVVSFCLLFDMEHDMKLVNCLTAYGGVYMTYRVFKPDSRPEIPRREVFRDLILLWICLGLNAYPYLHTVTYFLISTQPTHANIFGLCMVIAGVLTLVVNSMRLKGDSNVNTCGVLAIIAGCVTSFLSPDLHMSWSSAFQWCQLTSAFLTTAVLCVKFNITFEQIVVVSGLTAICPAIFVYMLLYEPKDIDLLVVVTVAEYILVCASLLCILYSFCKSKATERNMTALCKVLGVLMVIVLVTDLSGVGISNGILSLPFWKTWLVTATTISAALKLVTTNMGSSLIPLTKMEDDKDVRPLPFIGNLATMMAFLLACSVSPMSGFLWDVWCCGASLILVCLQKDGYLLRRYKPPNPVNPTVIASMIILVVMAIGRNDLWEWASIGSILLSLLELLFLTLVLPPLFVMWGIFWKSEILMSEHVVVFLSPLNLFLMLCANSSTSFTLGVFGLVSMVWMMVYQLPLEGYMEPSIKSARR
ncbi:hypothetical protein ScPMuIL_013203 [Solemya velum]